MTRYALRPDLDELRPVKRVKAILGAPLVLWCPFCDISSQEGGDCPCGAQYLSEAQAEARLQPKPPQFETISISEVPGGLVGVGLKPARKSRRPRGHR